MLRSGGWMLMCLFAVGCYSMAETPSDKERRDKSSPEKQSTDFVSDRRPTQAVPFDSKRALGYLEELCKIGPRISGTEGMKKQQEYLEKYFEEQGAKVTLQTFKAKQRSRTGAVEMANMIISWYPDRTDRVILSSHYDTRPIADQEPEHIKWNKPFISANDGTSGVAFLMELARHMKDLKTRVGVDFVLFDGEEYIYDPLPEHDEYFFGSKHFATAYLQEKPKHRYFAAVLLDMIAGKDPSFPVERNSYEYASPLVDQLWAIAADQKCQAFRYRMGPTVLDDHVALNQARIPCVDIIDFSYRHWHRLSDVPENCSPEGMEQVAQVLTVWLNRVRVP